MTAIRPVLIGGDWQSSKGDETFHAFDPTNGAPIPERYPVSPWADCEAALTHAAEAAEALRQLPAAQIADFLQIYADYLTDAAEEISAVASMETGLAVSPRLRDVELARTTGQLRQAAAAALEGSWRLATIDTRNHLRSMLASIGPVVVFGPNNFPLAFNAVSGGDFATAIAAGNPVIAKGHPLHPATTRTLAEVALRAMVKCQMPPGTLQLLYHMKPDVGLRLVSDRRVAAMGFTGGRASGLALKTACDAAGKPVYLEMSSINPVIILPGAVRERGSEIAAEFCGSCLLAAGQMCTNPGFIILFDNDASRQMIKAIRSQIESAPAGVLFSQSGCDSLHHSIEKLRMAGATIETGGMPLDQPGFRHANTLLTISASAFLTRPADLQTEMFGSSALFVLANDLQQITDVIANLEGNLTGSIYSARDGSDDEAYPIVAELLRSKVGRLNNDKMPTGVVVSPAMGHGGPYPATGHPGFTAVGIPAAMRRFAMLQCFDNVRPHRLPIWLRDANPNGRCWRWIDDHWTTDDVPAPAAGGSVS